MPTDATFSDDYGPQRLSVELANICNLHCNYCFRSEDNLYNSRAEFFPVELLRRVIGEARDVANVTRINFTGREPTLHPDFAATLETVSAAGMKARFVTAGWPFERVWPALVANRDSVSHVAVSLDGITRATHAHCCGNGSFDRLVRAFSRGYRSNRPFAIK